MSREDIFLYTYDWLVLGWNETLDNLAQHVGNITSLAAVHNDPDSTATLYACVYGKDGRDFSKVDEYIATPDDVFPNKKYGLNGRHILIGTLHVSHIMFIYIFVSIINLLIYLSIYLISI